MGQTALRRIRDQTRLGQAEMGERLGVSQVQISRLESGQRRLTPDMALAVAQEFPAEMVKLDLTIRDLLYPGGEGR